MKLTTGDEAKTIDLACYHDDNTVMICGHDVEDGIEVACISSGLAFGHSLAEIYEDLHREKRYASIT